MMITLTAQWEGHNIEAAGCYWVHIMNDGVSSATPQRPETKPNKQLTAFHAASTYFLICVRYILKRS